MKKDTIIAALAFSGLKPVPTADAQVVQSTGTSAAAVMSQKATTDALALKQNKDEPIANAEQLVSSVGINDKVPYNFRTTGGSADVGNRKTEKIIGGTIAWNQIISESTKTSNGITSTFSDGVWSFSGTLTSFYFQMSTVYSAIWHRVLTITRVVANPNNISFIAPSFLNSVDQSVLTSNSSIQRIAGSSARFGIQGLTSGTSLDGLKLQIICFDLTQMFGITIADYLYTLETATPGAGVAKFRQLFPKPYYAYNAGELMSVKTSKAISVGFNAYDNSTGKAKLVGGNVYQITGTYTALTFNGETITPDSNGKFTPSENGELTVTGGNATDTCVHLVWDGERDGEFESYKKNEYPLDSDLELRGVWKLDSNNDIYCDGDIHESDGKVTRRYGFYTFDGTEAWDAGSVSGRYQLLFNAIAPQLSNANALQNCVSSKYGRFAYKNENKVAYINTTTSARSIIINDDSITSISEAKAAFNGTTLVYELATPTEETADPYTNPMVDDDWGTEEFVDAGVEAGSRDVAVPVGHDTFYQANLRAKLEMAPDSPDGAGDYMVRQTDGKNSYVPLSSNATIARLVNRVPEAPSEDGTYMLKATVASGVKTYAWVADE